MSRYRNPRSRESEIVSAMVAASSSGVSAFQGTTSTSLPGRTGSMTLSRRWGIVAAKALAFVTISARERRFVARVTRRVPACRSSNQDVRERQPRATGRSTGRHLRRRKARPGDREPFDQLLLRRVDVLVLVDQEVTERTVDLREDGGVVEGFDGEGDLEAEREEAVPVEHRSVGSVALAQRGAVEPLRRDQLVRDDVDVGEEFVERLPVLRPELRESECPVLPRQEANVPVLVEDVVLPEPGDVVLEQPGSSTLWMVPTNIGPSRPRATSPSCSATRRTIRAFSSVAARSVKVNATIAPGSTPSATKAAIRREIDSVFPDPAQAMTWSGLPLMGDDVELGGGEVDHGVTGTSSPRRSQFPSAGIVSDRIRALRTRPLQVTACE